LLSAQESWVRLALVSEANPSQDVVDALVGDGDLAVNYTARWQRGHIDRAIANRQGSNDVSDPWPSFDESALNPRSTSPLPSPSSAPNHPERPLGVEDDW